MYMNDTILHHLKETYTYVLIIIIGVFITYILEYIFFGRYWTCHLHNDPDREILLNFLLEWIDTNEL